MRDEENERPAEVVGVVEDVRHAKVNEPGSPELYVPLAQVPEPAMTLVLRTQAQPSSLTAALRAEVEAVDPGQPVYDVRTYEAVVAGRLATERVGSRAFTAFAALALLLAAVGIYGVMAYSVSQRTRELGIRRALGAPDGHVLGLVLGQGLRLTALALAVGLALALGLGRLLAASFYGVSPADPLLLLAVVAVLAAVALVACALPARRATRVDPAIVLRQE
jgi:ABC-type lipoprotein release transport system permease subunit